MGKINCPNCSKKIESEFHFCPWCAFAIKKARDDANYGMLGLNDEVEKALAPALPFGLQGMIGGLMKQIEKELSNIDNSSGTSVPKGFKIQISRGMPPNIQGINNTPKEENMEAAPKVSATENARRAKLKKEDAKSVIRRLPEGIVYEINAPGVESKKDIVVSKLENNVEIRAYSKTKCFVKSIPLKANIAGIDVEDGKVFVRFG